MRNRFIILFIIFFISGGYASSDTFKFESSNIEVVENGDIIYATDGKAISLDGNLEIKAEKFEYEKKLDILKTFNKGSAFIKSENIEIFFNNSVIDQKNLKIQADGNVEIFQKDKKLRIFSDIVYYNIRNSEIKASGNVKVVDFENDLTIRTKEIIYNKKNGLINSNFKTVLKDKTKNTYGADEFTFEIKKNILKIKNANFRDLNNNNFKTSLAYINTKTNRLFGKDAVVNLENSTFNKDNEPRLKGNSIINDNDITEISKGVFTTCKKNDSCPPWKLSAEKIQHDKKKQTINYKNALLSVYDVPVMYFPKFFHPDPTIKRRSGFLVPTIQNSGNTGNYLNVPYFFAISQNKDITFSPRFYSEEKFLIQNEFRQVNSNSNHFSDFSFFEEKGDKSKNHLFYNYNKSLKTNNFQETDIELKIQKTSNDTYLKAHKLKSPLITNNNVLENSFNLDLYSNNLSIETEVAAYETLNKDNNDRYEYILPKLNFVKKIENKTTLNGDITFESNNLVRSFDTNKIEKLNINDFTFSSFPKISKFGFYNNYDLVIKNSNTDTANSEDYKEGNNYYLSGLFQFNSTLPLIKENNDFQKILTPKLSLKIAPNQTKDDRNGTERVDVNNIYSLARVTGNDTVEGGISMAYGTDYSIFDKLNQREKLNFKIASNLRLERNHDLPIMNQIGEKNSNIFSEILYSPNQYITTKYNTSLKNNLSDTNYENLIGEFRLNNLVTTFDYLNENNTQNKNSYLTNTTRYEWDENNSISYSTRENKTSKLTEYYNWIYQYKNDCLAASIEYNKDYYNDRDVKPEESIFFKLTIIPFGETSSPNLKK